MIKRIVRLTFKEGMENEFITNLLAKQKQYTRNFDGCEHLEVWQDIHSPNIIFSYSYWKSEEDLNTYRYSPTFRAFWQKTKLLFADKPYAVSVKVLEQL